MENRQDEHGNDLLDRAAEALRQLPVPQGPPPEAVARVLDALGGPGVVPLTLFQRIKNMKRIARIAVAATLLVAIGALVSWLVIGRGSSNMAFARVAEALDRLRSATYDMTVDAKGGQGKPPVMVTAKGYFLAPSRQRMETSAGPAISAGRAKDEKLKHMITIVDGEVGKSIMLMPQQRIAVAMDMEKMKEHMKRPSNGSPPDIFETVRRLVREGCSGTGEKVERLGKKEIDGHGAVGFRTRNPMGELTLWADPRTARPIRVEIAGEMFVNAQLVMKNFRYDVDLDPSLFSLEPPASYSTQTMNLTLPAEEDLLRTLRTVAEHNKGLFPNRLAMDQEFMKVMQAIMKPTMDKLEAKYGKDKLRRKPGQEPPPAMMAETMKTVMPLVQKEMQGLTFYMMLKPENDAHYVGAGVKMGTPDRPILWYKPTGAANYRVIYADLSVKDLAADEVKKLPPAGAK